MIKLNQSLVAPINESIKCLTAAVSKYTFPDCKKLSCELNHVDSVTSTETTHTIKTDPYHEYGEDFLDSSHTNELTHLLKNINYKQVGDQREVHYYGEYGYRYTGGNHEPEKIPSTIEKIIENIESKFPDSYLNSCL